MNSFGRNIKLSQKYLIQPAILLSIVIGYYVDIEELKNIVFALIWLQIFVSVFAAAALSSEELFNANKNQKMLFTRIIFFVNITLIFAIGWFFTGFAYLFIWFLLWVKRSSREDSVNQSKSKRCEDA